MGGAVWMLLGLLASAEALGRTSNTCDTDAVCPDNAFCRETRYCVCKDGYVYTAVNGTTRMCLKQAKIGEECIINIQCHTTLGIHSRCNNGRCICEDDSHLDGERCYESAAIGDRCMVDANCYLKQQDLKSPFGREAYCIRGYCTCLLHFSPRDNGTRCVRDAVLNEQCEDNLQCAGPGLECRGVCRCKDKWVAHNESNSCIEAVKKLGDPCDYDIQCEGLAGATDQRMHGVVMCLSGVCTCAYNARSVGNPERCWRVRRPGQTCSRDEECVSEEDEPGYCLAGRCTCKDCIPDAKDFTSAATVHAPALAAILFTAAILRH